MRRPNAPPTPRLADGTPNFGSTTPNKGAWQLHIHDDEYAGILVDPKGGVPYQAWAKALKYYRGVTTKSMYEPFGFCLPEAAPRTMLKPNFMEFIQQPELERIITIDPNHMWRMIYMDGRPHPLDVYTFPTWTGHAIGRWEGDTLVVDTVGVNEGHWLDRGGSPRTSLQHVIERFTRLDYYAMEYEATIDDPGAYTQRWTLKHIIQFDPELEMRGSVCQENNRWFELQNSLEGSGALPN